MKEYEVKNFMEKMKRFIECYYPATRCNLKCEYCYITQMEKWAEVLPTPKYSPETIGKGLSKERLGGVCHINICGAGETLLPKEMPEIIYNILKQGHYVMVITNGTITERFNQISMFPKDYLKRLSFKFSFHYKELLRLNKMDSFFENINKVKNAGASFSLELTPYDDLIPEIDNIKSICMEKVGAYCHITVARDESRRDIAMLTALSKEEYTKTWGSFESKMFDFKMSTFNVKRKEFCYAGDWSLYVNLVTGYASPCYYTLTRHNIFNDINKPIKFEAIGNYCPLAHCYNSHAFLTLGNIPELESPTYAETRNRITSSGTEWLQPEMNTFLSNKLVESNKEYSVSKKLKTNIKNAIMYIPRELFLMLTKK